ncbi:hypothetical protein B0H13DRAFT_2435810 [Mycena leptocephala]|nr:hypothetical protein B0H13DRAFT_2435810 [Mycena leptocephala]
MPKLALHFWIWLGLCLSASSVPVGTAPTVASDPTGCPALTPPDIPTVSNQVADQYIVSVNVTTGMAAHIKQLESFISTNQKWTGFYKFYSGQFDDLTLAFISSSTGVTGIERNQEIQLDDPPMPEDVDGDDVVPKSRRSIFRRWRDGASWHLARITQDVPVVPGAQGQGTTPDSKDWIYWAANNAGGLGVAIYVIDTGVFLTHNQFQGRASNGGVYPYLGGPANIIGVRMILMGTGGRRSGVANQASIVSIKVKDGWKFTICFGRRRQLGYSEAVTLFQSTAGLKGGIINLSVNINAVICETVGDAAGNHNLDICPKVWFCLAYSKLGPPYIGQQGGFSNFGSDFGRQCLIPHRNTVKRGTSMAVPMISGMIAAEIITPITMKEEIIRRRHEPTSGLVSDTMCLGSAVRILVERAHNDDIFEVPNALCSASFGRMGRNSRSS